jgi:hypothetical protein
MITVIVAVIVVAAVVLAIQFRPTQANHPPTIISLEARPEKVTSGASCQIVCNATDPDGDQLSYEWSATGGTITGEGATVTWTAPQLIDSYYIVVMVTDNRGGEASHQIIVEVRANSSPTITSVWADAEWTLPSGSINVTCNATDPDHDELNYVWTASGGNITGAGARVVWTAPEQVGAYNITVMASDGYGGSDTATLPVTVVTGQPPVIEKLKVTTICRDGKYKLKTDGLSFEVEENLDYDVECIVADASTELSYNWSCTAGRISGQGTRITWTAPGTAGLKVTLLVEVSDIAGNTGVASITFTVVSCSPCTRWPSC